MAIPIEFLIKASTAQFTKAVAAAENRVQGLKKSLGSLGLGNVGGAIGIVGLVGAFRNALSAAQDFRAEAKEAGVQIDATTAAAARLADAFDGIKKGVVSAGVVVLGTLASWGEAAGSFINRLRGISAEQERLNEQNAAEAEAALKRIAEARKRFLADNDPEKLREAEARLARVREEGAMRVANTEMRIVRLLEERRSLETEIGGLRDGLVRKVEAQIELAQIEVNLTEERRKQEAEISAEKEKQAKVEKQIYDLGQRTWDIATERDQIMRDQKTARADTYLPSVAELAETARQNIKQRESYGIGASGSLVDALAPDSPEMRALRAVEAEDAAKAVARDTSLDPVTRLQRASTFQADAEALRGQLTGLAQSSDTNVGAEFREALEETNKRLDEAVRLLGGLFKAQ